MQSFAYARLQQQPLKTAVVSENHQFAGVHLKSSILLWVPATTAQKSMQELVIWKKEYAENNWSVNNEEPLVTHTGITAWSHSVPEYF